MNKKLIKQLEGVGFEFVNAWYSLFIGDNEINYHYHGDILDILNICTQNKVTPSITNPTFLQILAAIKEHTGVDLTKKTKREEIEELKKRVEALEQGNQSQAQMIEDIQDSNKSQYEAIEKVEIRSDELEQEVKANRRAIHEDTRFSIHSLIDGFKAHRTRIEKLEKTSNAIAKVTFAEHHKEQEKKVFEVGNDVRISKKIIDEECCPKVAFAATHGNVYKIDKIDTDGKCCLDTCYLGWFSPCFLEHAPKESPKEKALEFGDFAETLVGKANIPKGSKVLITLRLDTDNDFYCSTGQSDNHFEYYKPEELKHL